MPLQQYQGRQVMPKVGFLIRPDPATITSIEGDGIWIESAEVVAAISREAAQAGIGFPQGARFLEAFPKIFIPLHQIEWLARSRARLKVRQSRSVYGEHVQLDSVVRRSGLRGEVNGLSELITKFQ
jgi:hypothetical protein